MLNKKVWAGVAVVAMLAAAAALWSGFQPHRLAKAEVDENVLEREPGEPLVILSGGRPPSPGMMLVAETDVLELYLDEETTAVAVTDKRNGHVWWSNPPERDADPLATPYEKEVLSSQLSLTYRDRFTNQFTFINFADSIKDGQFEAESIGNGVRITYTIGEAASGIDALPKFITRSRLEEKVLSRLDDSTARYVSSRYYPLKTDPDVLERLDDAVSRPLVLERMLQAFAEAGYTEDDLLHDNSEHDVSDGEADERPYFIVPLEYRLQDDQLVVNVPADMIEEAEHFRMRTLDVMMYFGAAGTEAEGYMLVPDGTGSLIRLNNGKSGSEIYSQPLYGENETRDTSRRRQIVEKARLPVYGLKADESAWLAEIESGSGLATIRADISGKRHSYNHAYTRFHVREEDHITFAAANRLEEIPIMSDQLYKGDLRVRYHFLYGDDANYSGMAGHYRSLLYDRGVLQSMHTEESIPFYVDIVGAITKRKFALGVPYEGTAPTTTFAQAGHIADRLRDNGVEHVHMRYLGWFNKGVYHTSPTNINIVRSLGSRTDWSELAEKLELNGGALYPDVAFQHVNRESLSFAPSRDAARYLTRDIAWRAHYNRARNRMMMMHGDYYLLSPARLPRFTGRFADKYEQFGLESLSLRDLGDLLHSDGRPRREVMRDESRRIVEGELEQLSDRFPDLMIAGGNAYALPYARHLIDIPHTSSRFNITDEDVPFYQMVVHGAMNYTGQPLNLSDLQDVEQLALKWAEYGMAPRFSWSYAPSSEFKSTMFDHYYSSHYDDWLTLAVQIYHQLNDVLSGVQGQPMIRHEVIDEGVRRTTYGNGKVVLVNYNDFPAVVDGMTVDARSFVSGGGP